MNMTQPDPAGLFEPLKPKQQTVAANNSVVAQLQNRPVPAGSLPPVNIALPPQSLPAASPQPASNNPIVAMSQSGQLQALLKAKAEQLANQPPPVNPIIELAKNGGIRQLVLAKEDQQYQQALADWEKPGKIVPLAGTSYLTKEQKGPMPQPPARDFNQIEQDWNRGVHVFRPNEFANMLNLLETGKMTPEQEAQITLNIEPVLNDEGRQYLQTSRITRDKYLKIQSDYDAQMASQAALREKAKTGSALDWEAARQTTTPEQAEQFRGAVRGVTFDYAFAPDEERLNSDNPEIVADERAKRHFYLNEQSKYPISSMVGNMIGATGAMIPAIGAYRYGKMARALKPGPPTQATASMIARKGAPATTAGMITEGAVYGGASGLARRPQGAEDMTLQENLEARVGQAGTDIVLGALGDVALTKGVQLLTRPLAWTGNKVSGAVNTVVKTHEKRGLDKSARELGYKDFDEFADAATEIITDETGSRIRLKPDILIGLSEADRAKAGDLLNRINPEANHVPGSATAPDTGAPLSRAAEDIPDETQFPSLKSDTEPGGPAQTETTAPATPAETTAQGAKRPAAGQAEPVVPGHTEPDLTAAEPPPGKAKIQGLQVVEAPISELTLSRDVPQFKSGADESGVVEPLGGTFDRTGVAPIQVWVRNDGRHEVISGRHRLDLARRSGEETIPAQYHYESEGFGQQQAATLDALLNIREGQGKVKDYVDYIKGSGLTEEAAHAEGILGRATGQRAYAIATNGSDTLIAAHRNDGLSDDAAARIANAAPGNERLQSVGIKAKAEGKSTIVAENMVKAVRSMSGDTGPTGSMDMFGFDDSAIREAEQLARQAGRKQDEIQKTLSAVKGASKNPTLAAKEGVDIHDPGALKQRITELEAQKEAWRNWHTNPDMVDELRADLGLPPTLRNTEPEADLVADTAADVPENQGGFFDEFDLTQPTARELEALDKSQQETAAREKEEQAALEVRARADAEVGDFELGVQGSGKDVSARQGDMLGLGGRTDGEQHYTRASLKTESNSQPSGSGTLYSLPIFRTNQDVYSGLAGGIYGGGTGATEHEVGSDEWWEDVVLWSMGGVIGRKAATRLGADVKGSKKYKELLSKASEWVQEKKPADADQFIKAPDGSYDFGFISKNEADSIGTKPGPIRLQEGWNFLRKDKRTGMVRDHGFGIRHIERPDRLSQIRKFGFNNAADFVHDVVRSYDRIYKGNKPGTYILAKDLDKNGFHQVAFTRIERGKNNVYHAIQSGLVVKDKYFGKRELLLDHSAVRSAEAPRVHASLTLTSGKLGQEQLPASNLSSDRLTNNQPHSSSESVNTEPPQGTTLFDVSSGFAMAARKVSDILHLNPGGAFGGAVYGGIAGGDATEERYTPQWWMNSVLGALGGAMVGSAGLAAAKKAKVKGKTVLGEQSYAMDSFNFLREKVGKIPGFGIGDKDIVPMKKQQKLLKALIERQSEKAGQYLLDNFTPSQRAVMSDLIEQRGIIAEGNLLHRQAKELDDFIAFTSKKLQDLGMLDETIEPGGYLHRYYAKDLGITGLMRGLTPGGKTMSGSWSRRRGTQEVFDRRYMSQTMRSTLDEVQDLIVERNNLKKQSGDLVGADTQGRIDDINDRLNELQSIEFREYTAIENGKLKSFFLHPDEVPVIPGLQPTPKTGLPEPVRQGTLEGMEQPRTIGNTGQLALTDRRWTIDGKQGKEGGILHRDWTKEERQSWGEIEDAAYRMVRGQAEVAHDLSLGIFYKEVVDRFTGTKVSDSAVEGWYQVPDTKIGSKGRLKKYGALGGKYVTPEVWAAIKHHGRNPLLNWTNNHPAVKTYLNLLGKWKAYKTVYNPVSHMNNVVSNLGMYYISDYSPKHLGSAIKELYQGENSALYREARDNGLFGTDFTTTLNMETGQKKLDELLEKLRNQPEVPDLNETLDTLMSVKQWFIESKNAVANARGPWQTGAELAAAVGNPFINAAKKPINKAANAMQKAYQLEDEFFKMAVYLAERQKGTKPFDAVTAANKYFFDYSEMPTFFQAVRDSPWGSPFISYTYYAIPALARTAVEKPEKLFAFAAFLEGINYAGMAINNELQDQGYWDQMAEDESVLPSWMQGRSLFGGLNNISIPFVDSYKQGIANMLPAGNPFVGNAEREGAWPAELSFWGPGPEGSNPIARLLFDLSNNRDWRGSEIYDPDSPSNAEKVRKGLNYIYQNITPGNPLFPGSYSQQKIIEGAANEVRLAEQEGKQPNRLLSSIVDMANATAETLGGGQFTGLDRADNEILFRDALYGAIGIKRRPVRIEQSAEFKMSDLSKKRKGLNQWITKHRIDYGENRITRAQIENYEQQYEAKNQEYDQEQDLIDRAIN